ncbi:MAG: DUF362 domain-containing protein [Bacillota bacterium]
MSKDYSVSLVKCDTYDLAYEGYKRALLPLGGIEEFVKPGAKVVIKPNLLMSAKPESGTTTHPEAVRAVIRLVKEAGGIPLIVESPGGPTTGMFVKGVFKNCGISKVAEEEGAEISFDMQVVEVETPNAKNMLKVHILKAIADADVVINMPKPKPHGMMKYTGAVKNMFGAVAGTKKMDYHFKQSDYNDFANSIIDIFLATKVTLNLMDGITTMHKKGPSSGDPINTNFLMASANAFAMDSVTLEILGAEKEKVYVIDQGISRGLCPRDICDIDLFFNGEKCEDITVAKIEGFEIPMKSEKKMTEIFAKMPKWLENILRSRPSFSKTKCKKCNVCIESCPANCLSMGEKAPEVLLSKCIRCYCCEELCPHKAVSIKRIF